MGLNSIIRKIVWAVQLRRGLAESIVLVRLFWYGLNCLAVLADGVCRLAVKDL